MPTFDYIAVREFRESLESDYSELRRCADIEAWKSVQILAGSIIEALLVDYISSTTNAGRGTIDPLRLDLAEAIAICRKEKVLTDRTADLCSVIRSYRNLIHPGRMVRLGEQPPGKGSGTIALSLVDMITDELAGVLRAKVGLTGEQIISKLQRDDDALTILKHLLAEVTERQRERLLLELIPAAHRAIAASDDIFTDLGERYEAAYQTVLETVPDEIRIRVASEFVRVLREEDGNQVTAYRKAFFKASDLQFVPEAQRPMVREHLLSNISVHNLATLKKVRGISEFLDANSVRAWLDPFIRTLISSTVKANVKERAQEDLVGSTVFTTSDIDKLILKRLDDWIRHFKVTTPDAESLAIVEELRKDLAPFVPPRAA